MPTPPASPTPPSPRSRRSPRSPRRRIALSQNFLHSQRLIDSLLDRSSIGPGDVVYEIGPGDGAITARLARRCRHVIAVEKDPHLVARLAARLSRASVSLYLADFLEFPLPVTPYKVFANVPFGITAAVLTRLIDAPVPPTDTYAAVQREAAERFAGMPDGPTETLTSALLKPWLEPTIVHRFDRRDFTPVPGVDVVLLRLCKRGPPLIAPEDRQRYRDFVTYCFGAWQPTVGDAIARAVHPPAARALASTRTGSPSLTRAWTSKPSDVPFQDWLALFRLLTKQLDTAAWSVFVGSETRLKAQQTRLQKVHRTRVRPPPMRHAAHAVRARR